MENDDDDKMMTTTTTTTKKNKKKTNGDVKTVSLSVFCATSLNQYDHYTAR